METTPKSLRTQIGIFGRTNVGKSSFLNYIAGQDMAVTSPHPGTTTDVVEKTMELLPIGPIVLLDTAGIDDSSQLSKKRIKKTEQIYKRADIFVLIIEAEKWGSFEQMVYKQAQKHNAPLILVINKIDIQDASEPFLTEIKLFSKFILKSSALDSINRDKTINEFKTFLKSNLSKEVSAPATIIGDLLPPGGTVILIVPIDLQAPKGRLILPQVQTIRDALDNDASAIVVKEREYPFMLENLKQPPSVVVCDSQVVLKMVADTPNHIKCTTFSILFARFKGDLQEEAKGLAIIDYLKPGDKILISEACSHHALEDDIGRVKIPRWLRQYLGIQIEYDIYSGRDYPDNLEDYKLVIHCGACMITRKEMINRINLSKERKTYITNYGLAISFLQGVIKRVLSPFPAALNAFEMEVENLKPKEIDKK